MIKTRLNRNLVRLKAFTQHWLKDQLLALSRRLDDVRVRQHLKRVEQRLRHRDVIDWPLSLQVARQRHLDHLYDYWVRGIFPRNHTYPGQYRPIFIDRYGRVCAVAHLLVADNQQQMAAAIASQANEAYLEDMTLPQLETWVAQSGLSKAELAQIQPTYPCPETCAAAAKTILNSQMVILAQILITGVLVSVGVCLADILAIVHKRWSVLVPISALGIILGAALFYIGQNYLIGSVFFAIVGYVPCPGTGVGDVCNPRLAPQLDGSFMDLIRNMLLLGTLLFIGNSLVLVKSLRRERFRPLTLLITTVMTTVIGLPLLVFFGGYFNHDNIFYEFDPLKFAAYLLIVAACEGLLIWLLGRANRPQIAKGLAAVAALTGYNSQDDGLGDHQKTVK